MDRIVIMADGKGMRWNNYMGIPKHFAPVEGERLIARTVRLLKQEDVNAEVIVTSHDPRYDFPGSRRYEPENNLYEIDRFTEELITKDMCFLYGDTFYTEWAIKRILGEEIEDLMFFGNRKSIVAVKIRDEKIFKKHVTRVKKLYLDGRLKRCAGWEVYKSFTNQDFLGKIELKDKFIFVDEKTVDVNTSADYEMISK